MCWPDYSLLSQRTDFSHTLSFSFFFFSNSNQTTETACEEGSKNAKSWLASATWVSTSVAHKRSWLLTVCTVQRYAVLERWQTWAFTLKYNRNQLSLTRWSWERGRLKTLRLGIRTSSNQVCNVYSGCQHLLADWGVVDLGRCFLSFAANLSTH